MKKPDFSDARRIVDHLSQAKNKLPLGMAILNCDDEVTREFLAKGAQYLGNALDTVDKFHERITKDETLHGELMKELMEWRNGRRFI